MNVTGRYLVQGHAQGKALVLSEPLSFWGGVDAETGQIIDHSHPALGQNVAGRILVMPCGRGSSSASSVLLEAIRLRTAPFAIILQRPDPILTVGALLAIKLYGIHCPILVTNTDGIVQGDQIYLA